MERIICEPWRPLGEAIKDYHRGKWNACFTVHSSVEEDRSTPVSVFFREGLSFSKLEKTAFRHCKGSVLDAGAGAGAHSLYLQKKNLDVTAMDISEQSAQVMRERGISQVVHADIFAYSPPRQYDTVLMMMNGIGIAGDLPGLQKLLLHLKQFLAPGGQIIFDSSDISYVTEANRSGSAIPLPVPAYYGTVYYQLEYKNLLGKQYTWLFVDSTTMEKYARAADYTMQILHEADEQYLASLQIMQPDK